jgi:hypothetical protein
MNARHVHAVLAAGVQSPELIARWQEDPQLLLVHGVEPGTLDLTALWKFAGLTVKVRHNGLREGFPLTFRLLHVAGLEIEVFASYASYCASKGQRYAPTPEQRARDLIAFLEHWLDLRQRNHLLIWDVIRHEQALARLARPIVATPLGASDTSTPPQGAPSGSSVPLVYGEIILLEMQCDPQGVAPILFQRVPELDQVPLGTRYYCYWRPSNAVEIRILKLDEFGYYALSFVDGVRTAAELSLLLGGGRHPSPGFLRSLSELAAIGILGFKSASKQRVT